MFVKVFIFLCAVSAFCDSAAVDSSLKCGIEDGPCQLKLIHNFIRDITKDGDGGSRLESYKIENVTLSIPELIEATLLEGTIKGLRDCVITDFKPNFRTGRATVEGACEKISMKGHYKFSSSSPALKTLLGAKTMHGDGNVKIKLEKVSFKITLFYKLVDRDGDIYFAPKGKQVQLNDLQIGKAAFNMDNIYLDKVESSERINKFLNEQSMLIIDTIGRPAGDRALRMGMEWLGEVFTSKPAKDFISDDLRPYVTQ